MPSFKVCAWSDIKSKVFELQPNLAAAIDAIPEKEHAPFYLATYAYGDQVFSQGTFNIYDPKTHKLCPISESSLAAKHIKGLDYGTTMPAGIVLDKNFELELALINHNYPFSLLRPGRLFAMTAALDPQYDPNLGRCWNIYSGAKHAFFLTSISDKIGHTKIQKELGINYKAPKPSELNKHHELFVDITKKINSPWQSQIILFDKKWLKEANPSIHKKLFLYELHKHTVSASYKRRSQYDLFLANLFKDSNIDINSNLYNVLNYVFCSIITNCSPGYAISHTAQDLPVEELTQLYLDVYQVKQAPVIMSLHNIDRNGQVYYSLNAAHLFEYPPAHKNITTFTRLLEIQQVIKESVNLIPSDWDNNQEKTLFRKIKNADFKFFHSGHNDRELFLKSSDIPKHDTLAKAVNKKYPKLPFPSNSTFYTGCLLVTSPDFGPDNK